VQLSSLKYEKHLKHYTSQPNHQYSKQTVGVTFHQENRGSPCFMPVYCTLCFNARCQLTPNMSLQPLTFSLSSFRWPCTTMLLSKHQTHSTEQNWKPVQNKTGSLPDHCKLQSPCAHHLNGEHMVTACGLFVCLLAFEFCPTYECHNETPKQ
jgi:hypothetical protein